MRHAGSQPANGGEPARKLNLILNAMDRLGIAQRQQRANAFSLLLNEVERNLYVPPLRVFYLFLAHSFARGKRVQDFAAQK